MYYVYEWYIVETGEVFYVGKGTGNRYKVRKHNRFFNDMLLRYKCESRIIKKFGTEKEAFSYEFERVNELKQIGQCVCNIYSGGFGGTVDWWTDELRERYSENNAMKSENQRKRMTADNPMKNPDIAQKANAKKRIPVIVGDKEYPSIKAVCGELGVSASTVNNWCIRGESPNGERCYYKNDPHGVEYRHVNNGQGKPLIYKGKQYDSTGHLARVLGISQTTASRWCRQGRDSYGNPCKYIGAENHYAESHLRQKHIPITVNGIWYDSKEAASRALNVSSFVLTQYLNGKKHDTKYICEYGNQQPSRGNTDNSTPEGSTTNR